MCVFFKPDSDMDPNSSGEGVNSVSSSIKRGLSVDSAQEVKRFRTATGAISAVRARAHAMCASSYRLSASFWEFSHLADLECGYTAGKGRTQQRETE